MMKQADITLTVAAKAQMQQVLQQVGKQAIRLSVREAGCSGLEYVMEDVNEAQADDWICRFDDVMLFVDAVSYEKALIGLQIDFQKDALSSAFVYRNPNKKGECGCGISFTV